MNDSKYSVSQIKNRIRKLYKSLEGIQNKCIHEEIIIKYLHIPGNVMKVCNKCEKIIGYPTPDELEQNGYK